jgi:hypothetical protein
MTPDTGIASVPVSSALVSFKIIMLSMLLFYGLIAKNFDEQNRGQRPIFI